MAKVGAAVRRKDFVKATVKMIAKHGVTGATTRRIAEEAASPLASLHYVFHTKEDLLLAVFELLNDEAAQISERLPANTPLHLSAPILFRLLMEWLFGQYEIARAQAELVHWALRHQPSIAKKSYQMTLHELKGGLRKMTNEAVNETELDQLARFMLALTDGVLIAWFTLDDLDQVQKDVNQACEMISLFVNRNRVSA